MVGVQARIEQLYRDRYVGFRNALTPLVGNREAARDVVQEAFAQALRDVGKLRRRDSLAPWVWKIAWRIALRERLRSIEAELPEDLGLVPLDEARDPELAAAIRSLPPKRRMVVFLRYFADFSYAEIAEALEVAEGTVAASLAQAHAALREQLMTKEVAR
jgi:RNA polymerase sigma factor (sigma-70 family)